MASPPITPPMIGPRLLPLVPVVEDVVDDDANDDSGACDVLVLLDCRFGVCVSGTEVVNGLDVMEPLLDSDVDFDVVEVVVEEAIVEDVDATAARVDDVLDVFVVLVKVGLASKCSTVATAPHAIYENT
jgi:hypothetical protein